MILRGATTFPAWAVTLTLLMLGPLASRADTPNTQARPVTATPPLQVVPATSGSKNVQQRMRACNAAADAKKLPAASRETFIKSCMSSHRSRPSSRPGSQGKTNP